MVKYFTASDRLQGSESERQETVSRSPSINSFVYPGIENQIKVNKNLVELKIYYFRMAP